MTQTTRKLTPREMIRAHAYPVLAAVSTVALVVIAVTLAPIGKHAGYQNRCIKESVDLLFDPQRFSALEQSFAEVVLLNDAFRQLSADGLA